MTWLEKIDWYELLFKVSKNVSRMFCGRKGIKLKRSLKWVEKWEQLSINSVLRRNFILQIWDTVDFFLFFQKKSKCNFCLWRNLEEKRFLAINFNYFINITQHVSLFSQNLISSSENPSPYLNSQIIHPCYQHSTPFHLIVNSISFRFYRLRLNLSFTRAWRRRFSSLTHEKAWERRSTRLDTTVKRSEKLIMNGDWSETQETWLSNQ